MTRINIGIKPQQLTDEHLRAEYREIQRLPSYYRRAVASGSINRIPSEFTLGTGHVLFFLDKWDWVSKRIIVLVQEMYDRGFIEKSDYWIDIWYRIWVDRETGRILEIYGTLRPEHRWKDYEPTPRDTELLVQRITERIEGSPKKYWHYRGARISKEQAIELLTKTE